MNKKTFLDETTVRTPHPRVPPVILSSILIDKVNEVEEKRFRVNGSKIVLNIAE